MAKGVCSLRAVSGTQKGEGLPNRDVFQEDRAEVKFKADVLPRSPTNDSVWLTDIFRNLPPLPRAI